MSGNIADCNTSIFMPSLCQDVSKNATQWPNSLAVSDSVHRWTWSEFEEVVGAIARQLEDLGAGPGTVVSVYMPNSAKYVASVYAVWAIGAAFCPINYRLSPVEADRMMNDAGASIVIVPDARNSEQFEIAVATDVGTAMSRPQPDEPRYRPVAGHDPAWLFFTSGTSGRPKPAVITHTQIDAVVSNGVIDLMPGLSRADTALAVAPLSHGALTHVLRQIRIGGHTVVFDQPRFDEKLVLRLIVEERVRSTFLVPTMVRRLCEAAEHGHYKGTLSHLLSGGEPISRDLVREVERVFGRVLTNYYGLAEVTGAISQALPASVHTDSDGPVTAGLPRVGTAIDLRMPDGSSPSPGQHGEIWVSGSNMFSGYLVEGSLDRSEVIDGWFKTKDVGYQINGLLYIDGRSSDMYISGGSNVYPAEVERVLNGFSNVRQSAVVGVPDERWGEIGVAFVVGDRDCINLDNLRRKIKAELAGYKVPRDFQIVSSLPYTPMDKIDKKKLRTLYLEKSSVAGSSHE